MSIVKIEIENDKITNIEGNDVTVMVVDYDNGNDIHKNKKCTVTMMDYTSRKVIRESKFDGDSDFLIKMDQV